MPRHIDADSLMRQLNRKNAGAANKRYTEGFAVMNRIKHFFLFPPRWLERILCKSLRYKAWVIREAAKVLRQRMLEREQEVTDDA